MADNLTPAHDRPHNAAHPHHHVVNEGITALPGNDGVDQLEMEKERAFDESPASNKPSSSGSLRKNNDVEVGETPAYASGERSSELAEEEGEKQSMFSAFYARFRIFFHAALAAFFTAWWLVGLIKYRDTLGWLKPFLVRLCNS